MRITWQTNLPSLLPVPYAVEMQCDTLCGVMDGEIFILAGHSLRGLGWRKRRHDDDEKSKERYDGARGWAMIKTVRPGRLLRLRCSWT
jgi:hypothetical protein